MDLDLGHPDRIVVRGDTVYLDGTLLLSFVGGNLDQYCIETKQQVELANRIFKQLNIDSRYFATLGTVVEYKDGIPWVIN